MNKFLFYLGMALFLVAVGVRLFMSWKFQTADTGRWNAEDYARLSVVTQIFGVLPMVTGVGLMVMGAGREVFSQRKP